MIGVDCTVLVGARYVQDSCHNCVTVIVTTDARYSRRFTLIVAAEFSRYLESPGKSRID